MARIACPDFIGRVEELRVLDAALREAAGGVAPTVFVTGEAGIGKSRLVAELAARAGTRVLLGGCAPTGAAPLPFAPLIDALRDAPELPHLVATAPALAWERGEPGLVLAGILDALEHLPTPLVLVLEDVHWADPSTLDLLTLRARTARLPGVLLVATYRSDELEPGHPLRLALAELSRMSERVELHRFGRAELVAQLHGIIDAAPDYALVQDVLERSDGNPFLTEEVLAAGPTSRAHDIVLARVETLSEFAQKVLRVLSAARRPLDHDALAAIVPEPDDGLREALDRHVIVRAGDAYAFRHALTREAIYAALLKGERERLHIALAQHATGAAPEQLADRAHHWYAAGDRTHALEAAIEAGAAVAKVYVHAEALTQYERALELWAPGASLDRVTLLARAAEAATHTGDHERATRMIGEALLEADDRLVRGLLLERLGRYAWIAGDTEQALTAYFAAVEHIPERFPERARALAAYAHAQHIANRSDLAAELSAEAVEVARATGMRVEEARALATLAAATGDVDGIRAARARLRDPDFVFVTYSYEGYLLIEQGRLEAAIEAVAPGIELMRAVGLHRGQQSWLESVTAIALIKLGRWDEASALLDAALLRGPTGITRRQVQLQRAELALYRGDRVAAEEAARDGRAAARGDEPFAGKLYEVEAALADDPRPLLEWAFERLEDPTALAWLCWRFDERERLMAIEPVTPEIRALQLTGAEAAAAWAQLGQPYPRALALLQAGDRAGARAIADALGARIDGLGPPRETPYGLTPRELEVLRLVERGFTNVQIAEDLHISPKTASAHVSNILAKLGVARRAEAAAIAARLDR